MKPAFPHQSKVYGKSYFGGSFGLISTARDWLHFEHMLANAGQFLGKRIISAESFARMTTNYVGDLVTRDAYGRTWGRMGMGYSVAVPLKGKGSFGWGGALGTRSWSDPVDRVSVVMMIQQRPPCFEMKRRISEIVSTSVHSERSHAADSLRFVSILLLASILMVRWK